MKIEATKKEIEELFKEKKNKDSGFHPNSKQITWILTALIICVMFVGAVALALTLHDDYITKSECMAMIYNTMDTMDLDWKNQIMHSPYLPAVVIFIGLAWVIHGVGFKIV